MRFLVPLGVLVVGAAVAWLMNVLWRRYYGVEINATLSDEERAQLASTLGALGFGALSVRPLFRSRSLWARLEREHLTLEVELCDGAWRDYTRLTCVFNRPLNQGIQILCEEGAGALGWLLSLQEARVDEPAVDERFILLAREEERLAEIMSSHLRDVMLGVRDMVEDFQLTDQALFVQVSYVAREGALRDLIKSVLHLGDDLVLWSRDRGPISALHTGQYQDALAEMDLYTTRVDDADAESEALDSFAFAAEEQ